MASSSESGPASSSSEEILQELLETAVVTEVGGVGKLAATTGVTLPFVPRSFLVLEGCLLDERPINTQKIVKCYLLQLYRLEMAPLLSKHY